MWADLQAADVLCVQCAEIDLPADVHLIMGIGFQQKVAYAAFSTLFIVIMSATAAVESVKADHVLVGALLWGDARANPHRVFVPSMMPICSRHCASR